MNIADTRYDVGGEIRCEMRHVDKTCIGDKLWQHFPHISQHKVFVRFVRFVCWLLESPLTRRSPLSEPPLCQSSTDPTKTTLRHLSHYPLMQPLLSQFYDQIGGSSQVKLMQLFTLGTWYWNKTTGTVVYFHEL